MQHPDITAAQRDGYPLWQPYSAGDTPELRDEYIRLYGSEIFDWLRKHHPGLVEDWLEDSGYRDFIDFYS